jgi:DNA-binding response OmpR family regulator
MILLDYALPGKNGFDICSELRTSNIHTPIIMISATKEIPHKVEGFYYGIDDYVTKPFYFEELFARIQAILRRPPLQENSILRVDDLALDPAAQKVMRGKESIYLTRKEFSLLEYLMKSSGRVVTRGAIIEHIWDMNLDPFSNTLETHILNLRKKIDLPRKKKTHPLRAWPWLQD